MKLLKERKKIMIIKINLNKIALALLILCTLPVSVPVILAKLGVKAERDGNMGVSSICLVLFIAWITSIIVIGILSFKPDYYIQSIGSPTTIHNVVTTKVEVQCSTEITMPWSRNEVASYLRLVDGGAILWINTKTNKYDNDTSLEPAFQNYTKEMLKNTITQSLQK